MKITVRNITAPSTEVFARAALAVERLNTVLDVRTVPGHHGDLKVDIEPDIGGYKIVSVGNDITSVSVWTPAESDDAPVIKSVTWEPDCFKVSIDNLSFILMRAGKKWN